MTLGDICSRDVCCTHPGEALAAAARSMMTHQVGALVVTSHGNPAEPPVGILTDRDIVRGQLRRSADMFCLTVADVMTPNPLSLSADLGLMQAVQALNERGVRRAPVVDHAGALIGIVTLDDLLPALAGQVGELAELLSQARHRNGAHTTQFASGHQRVRP